MVDQRSVNVRKAGRGEVEVLESHLGQFAHNHVHNLVTASEMVVEGDCHSVLEAAEPDGILQCNHLGLNLLKILAECGVFRGLTRVHLLAHCGGNLIDKRRPFPYITHKLPPLLICLKRWRDRWCAEP